MTISSLVLTDGTTTATLTDGTNYALAGGGWAPQVTRRRVAELGGVGPYEEIEEQIQIDIFSTPRTLATTLANVARVQALLDQARRWRMGESVAAVRLQFTMTGGTMKEAAVLDGVLELPNSFPDFLMVQEVVVATLRLTRRGLWLGTEVAATTLAARLPSTQWQTSAAWTGGLGVETPIRLRVAVPNTAHVQITDGLLIVTNDGGVDLSVIEAESITLPATNSKWLLLADTANLASGGNVLRYNHASANTNARTNKLFTTIPRNPIIYAIVRTPTATTVFQLTITLYLGVGRVAILNTTLGPYPAGQCQIVNLGTSTGIATAAATNFDLTCTQLSGVASTLDIDVLAFAAQSASVIRFSMPGAVSGFASGAYGFAARHNLRTAPAPTLTGADSTTVDFDALSYSGNIYLSVRSFNLIACMLAPVGTAWMPPQVAVPTSAQTYNVEISGTKAHYTPE